MAPNSKDNPFYLNADRLVALFNRYGHPDWYDFEDGKGICTNDIGEGLARMEYVRKRLEGYNRNNNALELIKRFIVLFNENEGLIEQTNEILKENKPNIQVLKIEKGKIAVELIDSQSFLSHQKMKLFISYSHDDDEHLAWVKQFAADLRTEGFEVEYDQDNKLGASWTRFMTKGLAKNERVLVIGTPEYAKRSRKSSGGTAFETSIININLLQNLDTEKFIPILRKGTYQKSFPILLGDRNGIDFRDDAKYDECMEELVSRLTQN